MEPVRQIETSARSLADMAAASRVIPARVRDLATDRRVRNAAEATLKSGRRVWEHAQGSNPKDLAGRFARDRRLQEEALTLLRSATKTVQQGRAHTRRRRRRRVIAVVALIGGAWAAVARLRNGRHSEPVAAPDKRPDSHLASAVGQSSRT